MDLNTDIKYVNKALSQLTTIFFDVDGVFTDGGLYFSDDGVHIKKFNVLDGLGCILLKQVGVNLINLTARHNFAVKERFKELEVSEVFTNVLKKQIFIKDYKINHNLKKNELAMVGDDLQDVVAKEEVGLFFTTPNAVDEVKKYADLTTKRFGGDGAVREICDLIIRSKGSTPFLEFKQLIDNKR